jgi:hypothetical protein
LSVLNSNFQAVISFTIDNKSSHTVPVLGFGINHLGPRTLAILPRCLIIVGDATHTSKFGTRFHFSISVISSSHHTTSAQAFFKSSGDILSVKTHILGVLPDPLGKLIVVLII